MRKRRIAGNITIILLSFLSVSCLNKTKFSKKDYDWINVYEENDILVFQEVNSKAKDTTIIKKKELYHAEYQPIARGNLTPHTFKLWYWNKKYENQNAQLIEMYKNKNNLDALPWLNYLGFSYELNNSIETNEISLELTGKSFNQVLFLEKKKNRNFKEYMSERPNILYWDLENGIIKYQTYKGEIWERINFK